MVSIHELLLPGIFETFAQGDRVLDNIDVVGDGTGFEAFYEEGGETSATTRAWGRWTVVKNRCRIF